MKQSTKLLSLLLALMMAFSCMTVIGNAALVQSEVTYDSIDDAILNPEQVADMALDLVENDLLSGLDTVDLSIIGELRLNKIDYIFQDVVSLRDGFVWSIGSGLLGNLKDLDFSPLLDSGSFGAFGNPKPRQRSHGDLKLVGGLLGLIGNDNNAGILSKAAYGIGTDDGVSLGIVGNFLDLGEIGDMLADIPSMLVGLVYDMLIYGSYNTGYKNESYPSLDDLKDQGKGLPAEVDTLDEMADVAILNLLTNPQDYEWIGEGDAAVKDWDEGALLLPSFKKVKDDYMADGKTLAQVAALVSPLSKSLFGLIDFLAQYALDDLGIPALNNNLKKALMEAVEIDINEVTRDEVDAKALAVFDKEEDYVTYIGYDCMEKGADGEWYYTTIETVTKKDANGAPELDEEGNEVTERKRLYYKANMASANEFGALINWDWKFVDSATTPKEGEIQLLYNNIIKDYDGDGTKSIVEGINDLIGLVYDVALKDTVKADFTNFVDNDTGFVKGANSNFMTNVNNIAKYILVNYGELVFGSTSPYAHLTRDQIIDLDTIDLVAMIGPGFFEDVMPQLIFPKNADGTYAFHDGVQIYEFGALVIREFISDIAPSIDYYDEFIFADGVGSANGRQFAERDVDAWFNIILNMGLDIAYTYLYNITNFGDVITFNAEGTGFAEAGWRKTDGTQVEGPKAEFPAISAPDEAEATTSARWMDMLDEVIIWGARYVGSVTGTSVLKGFDVNTISGIDGPLNKLSYILNSILPLGIANGFTSANYDFDVALFLNNGLKKLFETFDLSLVLGLLGRNTKSKYNMFDDTTFANAALDLVNDILSLVFRNNILQGIGAASLNKQSLDAVITKPNLKTTVYTLLNSLYKNHKDILYNALPVVGKLIKGWGTEQAFETPDLSLGRAITLNNGATSEAQTVTVRNASAGVWRHYKDQANNVGTDNQFKIKPVSVAAYDLDGSSSDYVTTSNLTTTDINYGGTGSFQYSVANVPATGAIVRFEYGYKVLDEDGKEMADGKVFYISSYIWLNYAGSDERTEVKNASSGHGLSVDYEAYATVFTPHYVPLSSAVDVIPNLATTAMGKNNVALNQLDKPTIKITPVTATVDGITFGAVSFSFKNGDRDFSNIKNFSNETVTASGDNASSSDTVTPNGGVNAAAWKAANKTSGSTTEFELTFKDSITINATKKLILKYYDDINRNKLSGLAGDEMASPRLKAQYNVTGTSYADGLLTSADRTDKDGKLILRDSNYSTTAWIDEDKNVYAESKVKDIVKTTDDDGNVVAESGKVGTVAVKKVTTIDNAAAWKAYEDALVAGARGGCQEFNGNAIYDFEARYNALRVATNDVQYLKKTTEELIAEGNVDDIDGDIDALKATLNRVEAAKTDNHDYTDYHMYRLNRLNDARDDAWYYINLKNEASNGNVTEIDESFPYTWIEEDDLRALVALKKDGVAVNSALQAVGGTDNDGKGANLVLALLEKLSAEEIEAKAEWLANKKVEYASTTLLDVQMAANYLDRVDDRLLYRFYDADLGEEIVYTTYLDGELESIESNDKLAPYTDDGEINTAVKNLYTPRSWAKFIAAYDNACLVYENTEELPLTQKNVFDVKWELQCCRNELVLVKDEADYSELEALIAQAEYALENQKLYDNRAKELGQVLAELGIKEEIVNADGDVIDLFPGSAYYINSEPYDKDDQDVIDQKASELKEALARLKFKDLEIEDDKGNANTATGIIVADDKDTAVNEEVTATIATIAAEMKAEDVKKLFKVTATGANVLETNIIVSDDLHYSVDKDLTGFAGTNSVVTFYTMYNGVKIPVATVRIVVEADINGDGAVDVLDATYESIVASGKTELEGCYFLAGNLVGEERTIDSNDYGEVVNRVKKAS